MRLRLRAKCCNQATVSQSCYPWLVSYCHTVVINFAVATSSPQSSAPAPVSSKPSPSPFSLEALPLHSGCSKFISRTMSFSLLTYNDIKVSNVTWLHTLLQHLGPVARRKHLGKQQMAVTDCDCNDPTNYSTSRSCTFQWVLHKRD